MVEKYQEKIFLGSYKVVKTFEHTGKDGIEREFVRIESQKGWTKEEALATFHMARIGYFLFPNNFPYPRLVRMKREGSKIGTYSIYAEYIPHDEQHAFITEQRNKNYGSAPNNNTAEKKQYSRFRDEYENSNDFKRLESKMEEAGILAEGKMYELAGQNVVRAKRGNTKVDLFFLDFNEPFLSYKKYLYHDGTTEKFERVFELKFDSQKLKDYIFKNCTQEVQDRIKNELQRLYRLIPKDFQNSFKSRLIF